MVFLQDLHPVGVRTWHGRGRGYEAGPAGRGPKASSLSAERHHSATAVQANENRVRRQKVVTSSKKHERVLKWTYEIGGGSAAGTPHWRK